MYQERLPRNSHNRTLSDVLLTLFTNVSEHGYDYNRGHWSTKLSLVAMACIGNKVVVLSRKPPICCQFLKVN